MKEAILEVNNVNKKFKLYHRPFDRLIEWVSFGKCQKHEEIWALRNISFSLNKGEVVGIIGANGAGKSTLLKILSRALWQTEGIFNAKGKIVSLLELGTGFNPELTGLDNIFNSGRLLGFSKDYLDEKLDDIINFAELGEYIDQPVKTYSSGMYVRLAFSLFANLEPDIYLVDEALSVGDVFFQQKCFAFLQALKERGTSIIIVSHDMPSIMKYCDRVIVLKDGQIFKQGHPVDMVNLYYTLDSRKEVNKTFTVQSNSEFAEGKKAFTEITAPVEAINNIKNARIRRGDKRIEIIGARFRDCDGATVSQCRTGDNVVLEFYLKAHQDVNDLAVSFQITNRLNTVIFGQSSYMLTRKNICCAKGDLLKVEFDIKMMLFEDLYIFAICASECNLEFANLIYDWIDGALLLEVVKSEWRLFHGIACMETDFKVFFEHNDAG